MALRLLCRLRDADRRHAVPGEPMRNRGEDQRMRPVKCLLIVAALVLYSLVGVAGADDQPGAGVVAALDGQATVTRSAVPQPIALHVRDDVFVRDQIRTEPHALVRVLLGGKALITMRELSVLTVTEEAGRVTVDLSSGKIGVAVVKGRMEPGEIIEIRSPNAIAAVRGTVFVVEVDPAPTGSSLTAPIVTTRVHLLHGALDVSARQDAAQAVRLVAHQSVVVSGNTLGSVQPISNDAIAGLTVDLKPRQVSQTETPADFTSRLMTREQSRAVGLATSLLSPVPVTPPAPPSPTRGVDGPVAQATGDAAGVLDELMDRLGLNGPRGDGMARDLGVVASTTIGGLDPTVSAVGNTVGATIGGLGTPAGGAVSALGGAVAGLGGTVPALGGAVAGLGGTVPAQGGAVARLGGTVPALGGPVVGALPVTGVSGVLAGTVGVVVVPVGGLLNGLLSGGLLKK
jgi:hypothetical protein